MKKLSTIIILLLFSCAKSSDQLLLKHINNNLIEDFITQSNIPGASIAIAYKNKVIWSNSYGYENLEKKIPASNISKFRVASISKLFTGTAMYKLYKEGLLDIDLPISNYLDSIPEHWKSITCRQIAQHTSGIGHYIDVPDALDTLHYNSTTEALSKFKNRPLKHNPDEGVTYSSYAYTVLAAVIEKVTHKRFLTAMDDILFTPLNMKDTRADDQTKNISNRTAFFQYDKDRNPEQSPYIDLSGKWAGSGFLSTAIDLARFGAAHTFSSDFFTKEDLNTITSARKLNDTLQTKEGLGWGQRIGWEGRLTYWGDGRTPGATCGLLVYPELDLSIAIVTNMRNAPLERGEFQILATRLVNTLEGNLVREVQPEDLGVYELDITIGTNTLKGVIDIKTNKDHKGSFDFAGMQKFNIADAFFVDNNLWVFSIGGGKQPIPFGIMPIKLAINDEGNQISGELYRIKADVKGVKK